MQLWPLFKNEVVRQNDKLFIELLNNFRVGNIDNDV